MSIPDEPVANTSETPPATPLPTEPIPAPEPTPDAELAAESPRPGLRPVPPAETAVPPAPPERLTLAQMFNLLPPQARIAILVALALVLTLIILMVFLPRDNGEATAEAEASATAVAAILTLTAQPTPTLIGTETPRIYIAEATPIPSPTFDFTPTPIIYVVQPGDTVNNIARRYNVTVQDIANANALFNANTIAVGQELIIPTPGPGTAVPASGSLPTTNPTPAASGSDVSADPSAPTAPATYPQIVIQAVSPPEGVPLRIAAGDDYQAITNLSRGVFASVVAKSPDGRWYLIQLEDGYTRGWVPADAVALLYPADPANIPTTPSP
jgi:LysM repeat protein